MNIVKGVLLAALMASAALAEVDLDWRTETPTVEVGDTVYVELYAVGDEPFSVIEVAMTWDADVLALCGVVNETDWPPDGYWMYSGFPPMIGGWNETFQDGDADYQAWPNFWQPMPVATPEGFWITTLVFEAIAPGETVVIMEEMLDEYAVTAVYDDVYGGWNIIGDRDEIPVEVLPEPLPSVPNDFRRFRVVPAEWPSPMR